MPGVWLNILGAISLVWFINLYNFMDGIDGIAAVQGVGALAGFLLVGILADLPAETEHVLILMACLAGFLLWNFPPAKIFMGDAGSGFLGITIGLIAIESSRVAPSLIWSWLILLSVFWVDATFTLGRRILNGHRPHEAHRSHAYQKASRYFGSHRKVTVAVAAYILFVLVPLAYSVLVGVMPGIVGVVLACLPLVGGAIWLRAGV